MTRGELISMPNHFFHPFHLQNKRFGYCWERDPIWLLARRRTKVPCLTVMLSRLYWLDPQCSTRILNIRKGEKRLGCLCVGRPLCIAQAGWTGFPVTAYIPRQPATISTSSRPWRSLFSCQIPDLSTKCEGVQLKYGLPFTWIVTSIHAVVRRS